MTPHRCDLICLILSVGAWYIYDVTAIETTTRIVGGSKVSAQSKYPFYAISEPFKCGASLIHDDILLSAAHCEGVFAGYPIYIGGLLRSGADAMDERFGIKELPHPRYDNYTLANDLLLVRLDRPSSVPVAEWNTMSYRPLTGSKTSVIGFGDTEYEGSYSKKLLEVELSVMDPSVCNSRDVYEDEIISRVMLCAGGDKGRDACQGAMGFTPNFSNMDCSSPFCYTQATLEAL